MLTRMNKRSKNTRQGPSTKGFFEMISTPQKPAFRKVSQEEIQKKAYELYEKRGRIDGYDLEDWLQAEKLVKAGKT